MPGALPIAGASAGDQLKTGTPSVVNATLSFAPQGFDSAKVSFQHSVYFAGQTGATVWFAFDQPYTKPSTLNVPFTFAGYLVAAGISAGTTTQFGLAKAAKAAQDFAPAGWDSFSFNTVRVWNYILNSGASVDFLFTEAYLSQTIYNLPFYFGGNPVVGGASAGTQTQFGTIQEVRKPLQASPVGFLARPFNVGTPRVGEHGDINFVFDTAYDLHPSALNTPFYFGNGLAVTAGGLLSQSFGLAKATKSAQDFAPQSWDSLSFGKPLSYFKGQNGAGVDFWFLASYLKPSTLNVPFYFSGELNPRPFGFTTLEFSNPVVDFRVRYLQPGGFVDTSFGVQRIKNSADFAIAPAGIFNAGFGSTIVEMSILYIYVVNNNPATQYGSANVKIVVPQTVKPTGTSMTQWGTTWLSYFNRYVLATGSSFTQWGTSVVTHWQRYLYQISATPMTKWGSAVVGTTSYIQTLGEDLLRVSIPTIDWLNVYRVSGWDSQAFGTQFISWRIRNVYQHSPVIADQFGTASLYNSRQYIQCTEDPDWFKPYNRGFGPYIYVYNAARILGVTGWLSDRFGLGTDLYNAAWIVYPVPVPPTAVPHIDSISNKSRSVGPYGFITDEISNPVVSLFIREIFVAGFRPTEFGYYQLLLGEPPVGAKGWTSSRFGQPLVKEAFRRIRQINDTAVFGAFGDTTIALDIPRYLDLNNNRGILGIQWGVAYVAPYYQYIYQHYPFAGNEIGSSQVIHRNRSVYPVWFIPTQYGVATVGRDVTLTTTGFNFLQFGVPGVDWGNVIKSTGWDSSGVSAVWVTFRKRYVTQTYSHYGFAAGVASLKNTRQYLTQYEDPDWFKPFNRGMGIYALVYNRNRILNVQGWLSDKIPQGHDVLNIARALLASGIAPSSEPRIAFISLRFRHIYPLGVDSLWVSWYSSVYNSAQSFTPVGIRSTVVIPKVEKVESNLRTIKHHTGSDTEWGAQFIAFRIRTVTMLYGKDTMRFGSTVIDLYERFVTYTGVDFGQVGTPVLLGPFKKEIKPRWTKGLDWFGYPMVKNKIPQAFVQGFNSLDTWYSDHWISFRVRPLTVPGLGPDTSFGRLSIKDRRQTIFMIGQSTLEIPIIHRIKNIMPDPPSTVILYDVGGYSLYQFPTNTGVGSPSVQGMPQPEGIYSTRFGDTWIRVQGCVTKWEWPSSQWTFGRPSLNATQYINVEDTADKNLHTQWGKPRFTPHTIWCRLDTPTQAKMNHPESGQFHEVDSRLYSYSGSVGPWWGNAFVSDGAPRYVRHYHRLVDPGKSQAIGGWVSSELNIALSIRRIFLVGANNTRFGYPTFPFLKDVWAGNIEFTQMGEPSVGFPEGWVWSQYIVSAMGVVTQWGANRIELLNRPIYPVGSSMTQWGNNTPMVHFPRHVYAQGLNATQYGDTRVEFRIRYLVAEGFDAFISEYDLDNFKEQMRVRWRAMYIRALSSDMSGVGLPTIELKYQYIRPYQIIGSRCMGHDVKVTRGQ